MNAKQYNIGFIGLGLMGKGFTERLVKKWVIQSLVMIWI